MKSGTLYSELDLQKDFGLNLVAVCRNEMRQNLMGISQPRPKALDFNEPDAKVCQGDVIVVYGSLKNFKRFYEHIN